MCNGLCAVLFKSVCCSIERYLSVVILDIRLEALLFAGVTVWNVYPVYYVVPHIAHARAIDDEQHDQR